MSRLTEVNVNGIYCKETNCENTCYGCDSEAYCYELEDMLKKLAHYEDLEEQGRLIEQKHCYCKSVDFNKIMCSECNHIWNIMNNEVENFNYCPNCGAKILTKEEAEAKLAEINNRYAINTEVNYSDAMNVYRELNTHDREKSVSELAELKGTEE